MASAWTRLLLFSSSYSPLWLILALKNSGQKEIALPLLLVSVVSIGILYLYVRTVQGIAGLTLTIDQSRSRDADILGYLVAYLLPFLDLDFSDARDLGALLLFIAVVGLLYAHSNLIYINPLLAGVGYHVHEVRSGKQSMVLLSKRRFIAPGSTIRVVTLSETIHMEKHRDDRSKRS